MYKLLIMLLAVITLSACTITTVKVIDTPEYVFDEHHEVATFLDDDRFNAPSFLAQAKENGYVLTHMTDALRQGGSGSSSRLTIVVQRVNVSASNTTMTLKTIENGIKQDVENLGSYVSNDGLIWACKSVEELDYVFERRYMTTIGLRAKEVSMMPDPNEEMLSGIYAAMSMMRGLYYGNYGEIQMYCESKLAYEAKVGDGH